MIFSENRIKSGSGFSDHALESREAAVLEDDLRFKVVKDLGAYDELLALAARCRCPWCL
jgi:hypothetical protein